jgi:hypothetical protein
MRHVGALPSITLAVLPVALPVFAVQLPPSTHGPVEDVGLDVASRSIADPDSSRIYTQGVVQGPVMDMLCLYGSTHPIVRARSGIEKPCWGATKAIYRQGVRAPTRAVDLLVGLQIGWDALGNPSPIPPPVALRLNHGAPRASLPTPHAQAHDGPSPCPDSAPWKQRARASTPPPDPA